MDCPSNHKDITGQSLTLCESNEPMAGLLCNPPGLINNGKLNSIEGVPFVSIDLQVIDFRSVYLKKPS